MAAFLGLLAFIFAVLLGFVATLYHHTKGELRAAQQEIAEQRDQAKADVVRIRDQARAALARYKDIIDLEKYKAQLSKSMQKLKHATEELRRRISTQESSLAKLTAEVEAVEETRFMQSFGFYRPKYGFDDSEQYAQQLEMIREDQKGLVKSHNATQCPQEWVVEGSLARGKKMIREHSKLMLRAFNGECDAAVGKVRYNNVNNLEKRINTSFDAINKLGESKQLGITRDYLNLKLQELYLVHEHRERVQAEREEQREIKAQMREEQKALKEIEKAKNEAEQEERNKENALERARQELAASHGKQTERLKAIVDKLEFELKEALERKAKAIARAQLTRSGHIYVLSNIGSFGEGVYKIGMTRRLEPLERVRELGDASVPFRYDVHAMIYSEDAPALENTLHRYFESRRVNMVNQRREFFKVSLGEIR